MSDTPRADEHCPPRPEPTAAMFPALPPPDVTELPKKYPKRQRRKRDFAKPLPGDDPATWRGTR